MKRLILGLALFLPLLTTGQTGIKFPAIQVENVKAQSLSMPQICQGKLSIVGMAMSRDAEDNLRSWAQPVYDKFISTNKKDIWDESYNVNLFFIPLFTGTNKGFMDRARDEAVKKSDAEWHPYLLFYKGDDDVFVDQLRMVDKSKPYIFILDESGKVLHSVSGGFSQKKMDEIQDFLDR